MKVRMTITAYYDDDDRRAIAYQLGADDDRKATYAEAKDFAENNTLSIEEARKQYFRARAKRYAKLAGE